MLVFDTLSLTPVNIIAAHKTLIVLLSLSQKGDILATASDKGTVIRVFSIPSGDKLFQFRRGSYPARITSMAFNHTGEYLAVGSDTETVHLFRCAPPKGGVNHPTRTWSGGWSALAYGPSDDPSMENTAEDDDMEHIIEQK